MAVASPVYDPFAIGSKKEQDELRKLLWQRTRGDGKLRNDRTISFVRKARKDLVTETIWQKKGDWCRNNDESNGTQEQKRRNSGTAEQRKKRLARVVSRVYVE